MIHRMKCRIRWWNKRLPCPAGCSSSSLVELRGDDDGNVTLADLKKAIVYQYLSAGDDCRAEVEDAWKQVVVSLGGEPLVAPVPENVEESLGVVPSLDNQCMYDEMTSLQSLGVVRGDTIYVLEFPVHTTCSTADPQPLKDTSNDDHRVELVPSAGLRRIEECVREKHLEHHVTRNDAIALLIHAALVDYGFDSGHHVGTVEESIIRGGSCKKNACVYEMEYVLHVESDCVRHMNMVLHLSMQQKNVMIVMQFPTGCLLTASLPVPEGDLNCARENNTILDTVWNRVLRWSNAQCSSMLTMCKDMFCRHVLFVSCSLMGIDYPGACLSMMPADVKENILRLLDFDDLCSIGMTCREFYIQHRDSALWIRLLQRYFPDQGEICTETNLYKSMFKKLMMAQREREALVTRGQRASMGGIRWTPPLPSWGQPSPRFPGITGGDYDRLPPGIPRGSQLPMPPRIRGSRWRLE